MSSLRIHSTAPTKFFEQFVLRYPDKQYQTWLGGQFTRVGTDYTSDSGLRDKLSAAIISHFAGYSFPTAMKIVARSERNDESAVPRFERTLDLIELRFQSTAVDFLRAPRPNERLAEEHCGIVHAELFLLRLLSSFTASRALINWGFLCEPLTILRSSLEQLAWAYSVGVAFDKKQLENPNPPKCVGALKTRFPAAGHLYGALSRFSHMDFEGQKHFVLRTQPEDPGGVVAQSIEFKFFGVLFYLFLLIVYQYICRDLKDFYQEKHALVCPLNNLVLPIRCLLSSALMRSELDKDEIAISLSEIYFDVFPSS